MMNIEGPDGITRGLDEYYDTPSDVEQDPYGSHKAIQDLWAERERLCEALSELADRGTLSGHDGELDYMIEDAREALGRDPKTNKPNSKEPE